ncbi:expressed unknown protein [Seminavis robusta]|uniref:Uncharacterized protein n=1 Tax=Seminavis robusta TaxID=568900 RepID=A0A9N8E4I0_9STRA|nr:expressed unknown protein [Seminavis robusta]|eukprot:Sro541_g163150.1 n/a (590) ;mRNA; r:15854-17729
MEEANFTTLPLYVSKDDKEEVQAAIKSHLEESDCLKYQCCSNRWCMFSSVKKPPFHSKFGNTFVEAVCSFHQMSKCQQLSLLSIWCEDGARYTLKEYSVDGEPIVLCEDGLWRIFGLCRKEYVVSAQSTVAHARQGACPDNSMGRVAVQPEAVPSALTTVGEDLAEAQDATRTENGVVIRIEMTDDRTREKRLVRRSSNESTESSVETTTGDAEPNKEQRGTAEKANKMPPKGIVLPYTRDGPDIEQSIPILVRLEDHLNGVCKSEEQQLLQEHHRKIVETKLTYNESWKEGRIQQWKIDPLKSDDSLFLCLHPSTFVRADKQILAAIYQDFDLKGVFNQAVEKWDLREFCGKISSCLLANQRTPKFFKCAIFVARVFHALKFFERGEEPLDSGVWHLMRGVLSATEEGLKSSNKRNAPKSSGDDKPPAKKGRCETTLKPTSRSNGQRKKSSKSNAPQASPQVVQASMTPTTTNQTPQQGIGAGRSGTDGPREVATAAGPSPRDHANRNEPDNETGDTYERLIQCLQAGIDGHEKAAAESKLAADSLRDAMAIVGELKRGENDKEKRIKDRLSDSFQKALQDTFKKMGR